LSCSTRQKSISAKFAEYKVYCWFAFLFIADYLNYQYTHYSLYLEVIDFIASPDLPTSSVFGFSIAYLMINLYLFRRAFKLRQRIKRTLKAHKKFQFQQILTVINRRRLIISSKKLEKAGFQ